MRGLSGILLTVTAAVTLGLGLTPTSFELSNFLGSVECRSVLAPMQGESFLGSDEVPSEVVQEWLLDVGYDDDGVVPADLSYAAEERGEELCEEARAGRTAAMLVAAVIGFALSLIALLIPRDAILNPKKP